MYLVIDIGNTLHKIAVFSEEGNELLSETYETLTVETIETLLKRFSIKYSIVSLVSSIHESIETLLRKRTRFLLLNHTLRLPIILNYQNPETLGSDRIANAVAARISYPGEDVLSIQAGTCIVYDFLDKNSVYHGGAISPGMTMRFKALHDHTNRLPLFSIPSEYPFMGKSTQQSIESGVINGTIFEIEGFIAKYKLQYPDSKVLITGGDSIYLQKSIKNAIFVGSKFILYGLYEILKLNVKAT